MPTFSNESLPNGGSLVNMDVGDGTLPVDPPINLAEDDSYDVTEDQRIRRGRLAGVLNNDDPGLYANRNATMVSGVSHGTLECHQGTGSPGICPNGAFTYTPHDDFSGTDSFAYSATDSSGNSYGATVMLSVSFVNDRPKAFDDTYTNNIGATISVPAPGVLVNDRDADGDVLTVRPRSGGGGLTLNADGSFEFTGASRSFQYVVEDAAGLTSRATMTFTMNPVAGLSLLVKEPGATGAEVEAYRWTVEEDTTFHPDPADPTADSLAQTFHSSYMPVVAQGCVGEGACSEGETPTVFNTLALDPNKYYYVSVLPADAVSATLTDLGPPETAIANPYRMGHTIGGAQIPPAAERVGPTITVITNTQPLPYAQISMIVFEDNRPTNGAIDALEPGLGGFQITLEDAGGRYGASAGQMSQNADGEALTNSLDCFEGAPPEGIILSCPNTQTNRDNGLVGRVLIKNLFPAKYGIITTAPQNGVSASGAPVKWVQTSTIEGTKVIDAWVKAGEPPFFSEFGPVGVHAFVGFVSPERIEDYVVAEQLGGGGVGSTISGAVTNLHMSRPPNQLLVDSGAYNALAHTRPWVGLNSIGGVGPNIAAQQATVTENEDTGLVTATFEFIDVPLGDYQVVVWDSYLDQVIAYSSVSNIGVDTSTGDPIAVDVTAGNADGNIPVFNWFARLENHVFLDENEDGIRQGDEGAIVEQAVTLRWRDGTVYQSFPTDLDGFVPFDQVFPFFNWLVAEVDYARFKATGLTVKVDHGGPVDDEFILNPQAQPDNGGADTRTETGQILTQGFQGFLGQTSVYEWGKKPYAPGENGGISGIVYYGVTRAEADPQLAAAEPWEPGIARVTLNLYREVNTSVWDDTTEDFVKALALVDTTVTDSWDDSLPRGCPGAADIDLQITGGQQNYNADGEPTDVTNNKCYDGLRNFNQARPAVFDGGYAFNDIPPGAYVVEVVVPQGYELMKEEDVNVGYGDGYASTFITMPGGAVPNAVPDPAMIEGAMADVGLAQPECVGELRTVPQTMSLFPLANEEAPFRGSDRPLCDRKRVILSDQGQSAADFTLMTDAPIAAHYAGMILDDVAQEFNPLSPQFGEKWAPPFVPVSIRDYKGVEISRVYSDQWGRINGLMPSTFTANMPSPSGFSPAMHMTCMNDPGPIPNPAGGPDIVDPQFNPAYSNFCYNFQYMPGATTYLDTPVLPVSAFASGYNPADCALDDATPMISRVRWNGNFDGPWFRTRGPTATTTTRVVDIRSAKNERVPNPAYEGPLGTGLAGRKTIVRDFGFGDVEGTVTVGGVELAIVSWNNGRIQALIEAQSPLSGELVVTRDNGNSTTNAVTVTVSDTNPIRVPGDFSTIQAAIDAVTTIPGDLILVAPGVYNESVIMWKPVRLQGAGAHSTMINAVKRPTEVLVAWRAKMQGLFDDNLVDSLPNQPRGAAGFDVSEGAAITVLGTSDGSFGTSAARIDGFSITGADVGGGILVNSYAHGLEIANNHVFGNSGSWHGGIRVGQPFLELPAPEGKTYGFNTDVNIHHNAVTQNGGLGGAGGGLSISTGSDNYNVSNNFVCGNFTTGNGGGIGHAGLSDKGNIANNRILFNQSFNQAVTVSGGGLFIGGEAILGEFGERDTPTGLGTGSGSVDVDSNLIQGNQAGAGHGGGIRAQFVNGRDIPNSNRNNGSPRTGQWYRLRIRGNVIVNNVAGWSGAGISLQDTARSEIKRNTIAHNDSTATIGALTNVADPSAQQPAGISTALHSQALLDEIPLDPTGDREFSNFSNPDMVRGNGSQTNILWENRAFSYTLVAGDTTDANGAPIMEGRLVPDLEQTVVGECLAGADFWDLDSLLLLPGELPGTTSSHPELVGTSYCNGGRTLIGAPGRMFALPALDEGGNAWIDVRFGPLTHDPAWSY